MMNYILKERGKQCKIFFVSDLLKLGLNGGNEMEQNMEYKKVDPKAVKSWRIGKAIQLAVILTVTVPVEIGLAGAEWDSVLRIVIMAGALLLALYAVVALIVFPSIEYKQWGYMIAEDKVVIRHGIFFIKKTIIPIIRIQNITVSQGPINRKLGLYQVEIALASGQFSIEGLDRETADAISENLKSRLYQRTAEKGVL